MRILSRTLPITIDLVRVRNLNSKFIFYIMIKRRYAFSLLAKKKHKIGTSEIEENERNVFYFKSWNWMDFRRGFIL